MQIHRKKWLKYIPIFKHIYDRFFNFDPKISSIFLKKSQSGLRNFFIVGLLGYSFYTVLAIYYQIYLEVVIRLLIIFLCLIPITTIFLQKPLSQISIYSHFSMFFIFILEIETQLIATDIPFHYATTWFADIIIILIYSMYFLGNPIGYIFFWFFLISYYCIRTSFKINDGINYSVINAWAYHIATYLFGSVFNYWWFKVRYDSVLSEMKVTVEYEKRIFLENELTKAREREAIFADIHDNLGGKLLDLSNNLNNLQIDLITNSNAKEKIVNSINEILKSLRSRLLMYEDINQIEENFQSGINLFLVRRYSNANKNFKINFTGEFKNINTKDEILSNLINIISELTNNDLKYGFGQSNWNINFELNELYLKLESETKWNNINHEIGKGHKTIRKRLEKINGVMNEKIENGIYTCEIIINLQ